MKLLLDTHAFLWWCTDDPKLSLTARNAIADEANEILVSAASASGVSPRPSLCTPTRANPSESASAQSEIERVPLVTLDPAFAMFGIRTYW